MATSPLTPPATPSLGVCRRARSRSTTSRPVRWRRRRGSRSTATDLVRWAAAHFHGDDRILSDDAKRQMQRTEWAARGCRRVRPRPRGRPRSAGAASSATAAASPGFITRTWWDPVDRIAVSVLTNAVDGPAIPSFTEGILRFVELAVPGGGWRPATPRPDAVHRAIHHTVGGVRRRRPRRAAVVARPDARRSRRLRPSASRSSTRDTLRIAEGPGYGSPGERYVY